MRIDAGTRTYSRTSARALPPPASCACRCCPDGLRCFVENGGMRVSVDPHRAAVDESLHRGALARFQEHANDVDVDGPEIGFGHLGLVLCRGEMNHDCTFVASMRRTKSTSCSTPISTGTLAARSSFSRSISTSVSARPVASYVHSETMRVQRQTRTNESSRPGDEQSNALGVIGCHARLCTE